MRSHIRHIALCLLLMLTCMLAGCKNEIITDNPASRLVFSCDTLTFDTVFTSIGSSTQRVMLRNPNANAIRIDRVMQDNRNEFSINIDGENDLNALSGKVIRGGDSIYIFVRVYVNPSAHTEALRVEDNLRIVANGTERVLHLEAYGQNIHLIHTDSLFTSLRNYTFTSDLPYLIYDTVVLTGTTHIQSGARLYFHKGASLQVNGSIHAEGTETQPIILLGDRRDYLFENVPYSYAAGQWTGVIIVEPEELYMPRQYRFAYTHIISAEYGLFALSYAQQPKSQLTLDHCRIHNHSAFGLVAQNIHSDVYYSEISNAASYLVYLAGAKHTWDHNTVANFFNSTNIRVQNIGLNRNLPVLTVDTAYDATSMAELTIKNSIVTGLNRKYIHYVVDSFMLGSIPTHAPDSFPTCYVAADTTGHLFRNTYFEYKVYDYYDFRLDSLSPARQIGEDQTDAGCYPE